MIRKEDCYQLGTVGKTHGVEGELVLKFNHEIVEAYYQLESVFVDLDGGLVPFLFKGVRDYSDKMLLAKFELIETPEEAEELIGCPFFIFAQQAKSLGVFHPSLHEIIGFVVSDPKFGTIGKVSDLIHMPNNNLLQVFKDGKEILIPFNEDLIHDVDFENKTLSMNLPEGLLEV